MNLEHRTEKIINKIESIPDSLIIFSIFFLNSLLLFIWLKLDISPPHWDEAVHLNSAVSYYNILSTSALTFVEKLKEILYIDTYYPPFVHFLTGLFYFLLPVSVDTAVFVNFVFIYILTFSVFKIGKSLYDKPVAILSSIIIFSFQIYLTNFHDYMMLLPLTAFVSLGILVSLKTENFNSRKYSILLGIIFGLGLLIKWTFFLFTLPLILHQFYKGVKKNKKITSFNLLIFLFISGIIIFPWYSSTIINLLLMVKQWTYKIGAIEGDPEVLSVASLIYYLSAINSQTSFIWFLLISAAMVITIIKQRKDLKVPLVLWILIPLILFTFLRNKDPRYTAAFLPAFSLILSNFILNFLTKRIRAILVAFSLSYNVLFILIFLFTSFNLSFFHLGSIFISAPPDQKKWPIEKSLDIIKKSMPHSKNKIIVRIIPNVSVFNRLTFRYYASKEKLPIKILGTFNYPMFTDFLILKSKNQGPFADKSKRITEVFKKNGFKGNNLFKKIAELPLPDGSKEFIFKRYPKGIKNTSKSIDTLIKNKFKQITKLFLKDAENFNIIIDSYNAERDKKGEFKKIKVMLKRAIVGDYKHNDIGLPISNLIVQMNEIGVNLSTIINNKKIELLKLRSMSLKGQINERDLEIFIMKSLKNKGKIGVKITEKGIELKGFVKRPNLSFELVFKPIVYKKRNIYIKIEKIKIGFLRFPSLLAQILIGRFNPIIQSDPIQLIINDISLKDNKITIQ